MRLPENPLGMAGYPVSVDTARAMRTCSAKTNVLMEKRTYLFGFQLPGFGILCFCSYLFSRQTILNVCWCCECVEWTNPAHIRTRSRQTYCIYGFGPPTLSHMADPSGPHLQEPRFIICLTEGPSESLLNTP